MEFWDQPNMNVSVCMAVYNGANFIQQQIASILPQMGDHDEFVIVDDASSDDTVAIIEAFCDERIRVVRQQRNCGVVKTFGRALAEARGEIIFLTDHDDVWPQDKMQKFLDMFSAHPDVTVVMSDLVVMDEGGEITSGPKFGLKAFHAGIFCNLMRNNYQGSAMAFRRVILQYCLPFPLDIPIHDVWIGLVNQLVGEAAFIPEPLLFYRRHGSNDSPQSHAPLFKMVRWRWALTTNLVHRYLSKIAFRQRPPSI